MKTTVRATYSNGTLMPETALDFEEGQEVMLTVENAETVGERLGRDRRKLSVEEKRRELRAIRKRCARLLKDGKGGPSAVEHGDWLYDENGLPK